MKKKIIILAIMLVAISISACSINKYSSWHLNSMRIDKLWSYSKGETQTIAFIDTGLSEELLDVWSDRIVAKHNMLDSSNNVIDKNGHGTEMVSLACGDGYEDVYGIAPLSKIIIIKAVNDEGKTNNEYLLKGLEFAEKNEANIVNISIGGSKSNQMVVDKIKKMTSHCITIVAAGGDYGNKDLLFPANQNGVVSVEAKNKQNELYEMSNTHKKSVLRFPGEGVEVLTTVGNSVLLDTANGTSQATAIASGYIALLRDYYIKKKSMFLNNKEFIKELSSLNTISEEKTNYLAPFK